MNPLCASGGSNRSRCGAVHILSAQSEPPARFGVESLSLWRGAHLETEVSFSSAAHKCPLEVSCRSKVSIKSVAHRKCRQKCCSEVSVRSRSVAQKCRSEVSNRSVAEKCCSDVSLRNVVRRVDQKCCSELELLIRSEVWIRRVAQNCR